MEYLRPVSKKLTSENRIEELKQLRDDKSILSFLLNFTEFETVSEEFESRYGFKLIRINPRSINKSLIKDFDLDVLKAAKVLPISLENNEYTFAISSITNESDSIFTKLAQKKGAKAKFVFALEHEILELLNGPEDNKEENKLIDVPAKDAIKWVDAIIAKGFEIRASDIHIEPLEEGVRVRYRVDGSMMGAQIFNITEKQLSNIHVRLKVIAKMDISEKRKSQDGRIDGYEYDGISYSMRVSTVNTIHGEKFVMRIFDENSKSKSFEDLGFFPEQIESIKRMLSKSNGIIYLAGATGSGKTTTLYSMIENLDKEELNIYTIENPAEKKIPGVNQIQVDEQSQNTYPSVLKTLLRQDPDVMVVGEIRETETANIAVQASLTGHLVITTIHANNAVESITRLSDLKVESYLLGASSVGFLSQRLVRILCTHCKQKVEELPTYERLWIESLDPEFDYEKEKEKGNYFYSACGCDKCIKGYKGRVAVLEIIEVDDEMKDLISRNVSKKELNAKLSKNNFKRMRLQGLLNAKKGITSMEELMGKL